MSASSEPVNDAPIVEALIVGGGPAGLAAAIQLRRYGLSPLVFEREAVGGLLRNANHIENYPGFPHGIAGVRLAGLIEAQARQAGVAIRREAVLDLSWDGAVFTAITSHGRYIARQAVIASGTTPHRFAAFDIPESLRDRVVYEVYPLLNLEGKQIVIAGAGDAAFDYALSLGRKNDVIILNRSGRLKCLPLLWERANACPRITYRPHTHICGLKASAQDGMTVECSNLAGAIAFQAHVLLGALGRDPQMDFVASSVRENSAALESRGILHMIGDVKNGIYRQAAIAVGDGVRAAMRIYRTMMEEAL